MECSDPSSCFLIDFSFQLSAFRPVRKCLLVGFLGGLSVTFSCKASFGSDEELLKAVEEIESVSTKRKKPNKDLSDEELLKSIPLFEFDFRVSGPS